MMRTHHWLIVGLLLVGLISASAREIEFAGYTWTVRTGQGGPGPNAWEDRNVWLDAATNLHLKISQREGKWSCAEVTMRKRLEPGSYVFRVSGGIDRLDDNVVLGLFNYPTGDVGGDATHEIDIEFARWGDPKNPIGNYTVWPVDTGLRQTTKPFGFRLNGEQSTHRFVWRREQIEFRSWQGWQESGEELGHWLYSPQDAPRHISTAAMPVHLNLWLFKGLPPKDGKEVEIVVQDFGYTTR